MPTPREGETKEDFISRCIPDVMDEGREQEQAAAMCYSYWDDHVSKADTSEDNMGKTVDKRKDAKKNGFEFRKRMDLAERYWDVADALYNELSQYWYDVKYYDDAVIVYFNDGYYEIEYEYNDGEVVFADKDSWKPVEEQWVAKRMRELDEQAVEYELAEGEEHAEFEFNVSIAKADGEKQIAYGVVYVPNEFDTQGHMATEAEIEKAAHWFLASHLMKSQPASDDQHRRELSLNEAVPVESYIAPVDMVLGEQDIVKGSWVVGMYVPSKELWQQIKKGEKNAFSMRGMGVLEELEELEEFETGEVEG